MQKNHSEIIFKVTARPVVDLTEMDILVDDFDIEREYGGWQGSWLEPAEAPTKEYKINRIVLEGLDHWEKDDIKEIHNLKKGDKVNLDFTFDEEEDHVEVKENEVMVIQVKQKPEVNEIELVVEDLYAEWKGASPPQSQRGRA